jgi:hypothetical protein
VDIKLSFTNSALCHYGALIAAPKHKSMIMKKNVLVLLVCIALFGLTTSAQIQKGYYLIGGNLATTSVGFSDGTPFQLNLTPKVAWFQSNNFAVGGFVDLGVATAKGQGTTFTYGVGPLARYYFGTADVATTTTSARRSSRVFLEGTVGISGVNVSGGSSTNGLGIGIGPGVAFFVNENIALEALLKYNKAFGFGNDGGSSILQLGLGFQLYLPRGTVRSTINKVRD